MKFNVLLFVILGVLMIVIPLSNLGMPSMAHTGQAADNSVDDVKPFSELLADSAQSAASDNTAPEADTSEQTVSEPAVAASAALKGFKILDSATGEKLDVGYMDFLKGSVCAEMPATFNLEALKAQAVAAYTYAVYQKERQAESPDPALMGCDFSASPSEWKVFTTEAEARKRFGDKFDVYWNKISQAAEEAAGYMIEYDGAPIVAAYCSASAGITESAGDVWQGDLPYLRPVDSFGDKLSPYAQVPVSFTAAQVKAAFAKAGYTVTFPADQGKWFAVLTRSAGGYVTAVTVGDKLLKGTDVRAALGLNSAAFEVTQKSGVFTFICSGYGHGVGLSQYGADYMARQGSTFIEILTYYYTGAEVVKIEN